MYIVITYPHLAKGCNITIISGYCCDDLLVATNIFTIQKALKGNIPQNPNRFLR